MNISPLKMTTKCTYKNLPIWEDFLGSVFRGLKEVLQIDPKITGSLDCYFHFQKMYTNSNFVCNRSSMKLNSEMYRLRSMTGGYIIIMYPAVLGLWSCSLTVRNTRLILRLDWLEGVDHGTLGMFDVGNWLSKTGGGSSWLQISWPGASHGSKTPFGSEENLTVWGRSRRVPAHFCR